MCKSLGFAFPYFVSPVCMALDIELAVADPFDDFRVVV